MPQFSCNRFYIFIFFITLLINFFYNLFAQTGNIDFEERDFTNWVIDIGLRSSPSTTKIDWNCAGILNYTIPNDISIFMVNDHLLNELDLLCTSATFLPYVYSGGKNTARKGNTDDDTKTYIDDSVKSLKKDIDDLCSSDLGITSLKSSLDFFTYQKSRGQITQNIEVSDQLRGAFKAMLTSKSGCMTSTSITLSNSDFSSIDAGDDAAIDQGVATSLSTLPSGGITTFSWTAAPADSSLTGLKNYQKPTVLPNQKMINTTIDDFENEYTNKNMVASNVNALPESCFDINLVPNSNFEDFIQCPTFFSFPPGTNLSTWLSDWTSPNQASPDYFNSCADPDTVGVPLNSLGYQETFDGDGYIGILAYELGNIYSEYAQVKLNQPLESGKTYQVKINIALGDNAGYAVDKIGMLFSKDAIQASNNDPLINTPQWTTPDDLFIENINEWATFTWLYIPAQNNEEYLTIGRFGTNPNRKLTGNGSNGHNFQAYYYVDAIEVFEMFAINTGPDITINQGDTIAINATSTGGDPTYTWTANPVDISLSGQMNAQNPNVSPTQDTTYTVVVDFGDGCTNSDTVTVTVINQPCLLSLDESNLQLNIADCGQMNGSINEITISGNSGDEVHVWTDQNGNIAGTSLQLHGIGRGSYSLRVTDNDCSINIGPFTINEVDSCQEPESSSIKIATTMTPNGDDSNDMFMILGLEHYPNNRLYVFNRWGNKVYEAFNYQNDWFGTYQNKILPVATYYYILELNDPNKQVFKGAMTIIK